VIFVIRTAGNLLRSRPSDALVITTLLVVLVGFVVPFLPVAGTRGFAPAPPAYFAFLAGAIVMYLLLVEALKRRPAGRMLR
jgi:Mg2+-importing ATPase